MRLNKDIYEFQIFLFNPEEIKTHEAEKQWEKDGWMYTSTGDPTLETEVARHNLWHERGLRDSIAGQYYRMKPELRKKYEAEELNKKGK